MPAESFAPSDDAHAVGASLRHLPGMVCFDDVTASGRWGGEWVAALPDHVMSGTLSAGTPPVPAPGEFWAGTIDYEGAWRFSRFPAWLHRPAPGMAWCATGGLAGQCKINPYQTIPLPVDWKAGISREDYMAMVLRAKEYIAAGDIYQVNLAHRFAATWREAPDAWAMYTRLRGISPAPHAAYLDQGDRVVLSASPETLIDRQGRTLFTRPIKGTRPRGDTPQADLALSDALRHCAKERAELVMITDLERNDLGRVAVTGSVNVEELCALESFPQVHHLVSRVAAELRPGVSWPGIWEAIFPGGSITGAPKKRAIEIISELEPQPRGLYTGAIGWMFGPDRACFSIAIRTAVLAGSTVHFHAGAGIVEGSDPAAEFDETHHKAIGLIRAILAPD